MATHWLPDSIAITPVNTAYGSNYASYVDEPAADGGYVSCAEPSIFDPLTKLDIERAEDDRYVHIRFHHNNKYWSRENSTDSWIVAISNQPIEDTSNPLCTLFEPIMLTVSNTMSLVQVGRGIRYPVQLRGNRLIGGRMGLTWAFVDMQTVVKLPARVSFKGDNGLFLRAVTIGSDPHLQFSSTDRNERECAFEIEPNNDGHIGIKSTHFNRYLRRSANNWILADAVNGNANSSLFWPVHVTGSTYALRTHGTNNFCQRLTDGTRTNILSASTSTITNTSRLEIQELVIERHIYHIRFRMDQVRIFDEIPFIAGVGTSVNNTDEESSLTINVSYEDTHSYSFTNGLSTTGGVATTITVGWPKILAIGIEMSSEETSSFEWGETHEETRKAEASVTVVVPPRSRVRVDYVGTQGSCSIPFSYTQRDKSSSDGAIVAHSNIDGLFEGVNYHSFHFEHYVVEPLPEDELIK